MEIISKPTWLSVSVVTVPSKSSRQSREGKTFHFRHQHRATGLSGRCIPEEMEETFNEIHKGQYNVEERSVLQLSSNKRRWKYSPYALNDIAILKRDSSSMITIHTSINDAYLAAYRADGLIICYSNRFYCLFIKCRRDLSLCLIQYNSHNPGSSSQPEYPSHCYPRRLENYT